MAVWFEEAANPPRMSGCGSTRIQRPAGRRLLRRCGHVITFLYRTYAMRCPRGDCSLGRDASVPLAAQLDVADAVVMTGAAGATVIGWTAAWT